MEGCAHETVIVFTLEVVLATWLSFEFGYPTSSCGVTDRNLIGLKMKFVHCLLHVKVLPGLRVLLIHDVLTRIGAKLAATCVKRTEMLLREYQ